MTRKVLPLVSRGETRSLFGAPLNDKGLIPESEIPRQHKLVRLALLPIRISQCIF